MHLLGEASVWFCFAYYACACVETYPFPQLLLLLTRFRRRYPSMLLVVSSYRDL
jgi:hypothetical protein